jgi:hypothetical protein
MASRTPDWETHRTRIVSLYVSEKICLDEVVEIMASQYGFNAR